MSRGRDFKVTYFMIQEIGVSAIPGSCKRFPPSIPGHELMQQLTLSSRLLRTRRLPSRRELYPLRRLQIRRWS